MLVTSFSSSDAVALTNEQKLTINIQYTNKSDRQNVISKDPL
jgi:hypothetical protein